MTASAQAPETRTSPSRFMREDAYIELPMDFVDELDTAVSKMPGVRGRGAVDKMKRTRSFRLFFAVTDRLSQLGEQSSLTHEEIRQISGSQLVLGIAEATAKTEHRVVPELDMRIRLSQALAPITARVGTIVETHDQARMLDSYEQLLFPDAYKELLAIGFNVMQKIDSAKDRRELEQYAGFGQEVAFHLMFYRKQSALRFTTPSDVHSDFFGENGERFDALAYNLKLGRERQTKVQIKRQPNDFTEPPTNGVKIIYGSEDLHNMPDDLLWSETPQANYNLPTLAALLDEATGDTSVTPTLDKINHRLHSRLFS